jgi:hypothetical protein
MTPEEMLRQLNEAGGQSGSTFNEGALMGWFGWEVSGEVLTVSFEQDVPEDSPAAVQEFSWRLVPVDPNA